MEAAQLIPTVNKTLIFGEGFSGFELRL